jgi:hypothetical protein
MYGYMALNSLGQTVPVGQSHPASFWEPVAASAIPGAAGTSTGISPDGTFQVTFGAYGTQPTIAPVGGPQMQGAGALNGTPAQGFALGNFTAAGGQANVPYAIISPGTAAAWTPNIGTLDEQNPSRYIPAETSTGNFITAQGYYDTFNNVFDYAYLPPGATAATAPTTAGAVNIGWEFGAKDQQTAQANAFSALPSGYSQAAAAGVGGFAVPTTSPQSAGSSILYGNIPVTASGRTLSSAINTGSKSGQSMLSPTIDLDAMMPGSSAANAILADAVGGALAWGGKEIGAIGGDIGSWFGNTFSPQTSLLQNPNLKDYPNLQGNITDYGTVATPQLSVQVNADGTIGAGPLQAYTPNNQIYWGDPFHGYTSQQANTILVDAAQAGKNLFNWSTLTPEFSLGAMSPENANLAMLEAVGGTAISKGADFLQGLNMYSKTGTLGAGVAPGMGATPQFTRTDSDGNTYTTTNLGLSGRDISSTTGEVGWQLATLASGGIEPVGAKVFGEIMPEVAGRIIDSGVMDKSVGDIVVDVANSARGALGDYAAMSDIGKAGVGANPMDSLHSLNLNSELMGNLDKNLMDWDANLLGHETGEQPFQNIGDQVAWETTGKVMTNADSFIRPSTEIYPHLAYGEGISPADLQYQMVDKDALKDVSVIATKDMANLGDAGQGLGIVNPAAVREVTPEEAKLLTKEWGNDALGFNDAAKLKNSVNVGIGQIQTGFDVGEEGAAISTGTFSPDELQLAKVMMGDAEPKDIGLSMSDIREFNAVREQEAEAGIKSDINWKPSAETSNVGARMSRYNAKTFRAGPLFQDYVDLLATNRGVEPVIETPSLDFLGGYNPVGALGLLVQPEISSLTLRPSASRTKQEEESWYELPLDYNFGTGFGSIGETIARTGTSGATRVSNAITNALDIDTGTDNIMNSALGLATGQASLQEQMQGMVQIPATTTPTPTDSTPTPATPTINTPPFTIPSLGPGGRWDDFSTPTRKVGQTWFNDISFLNLDLGDKETNAKLAGHGYKGPIKVADAGVDTRHLNKKLVEMLPDGRRVYDVNGNYIRKHYPATTKEASGADFRLGGNHEAYPKMVPKKELWRESTDNPVSRKLYRQMKTTPGRVTLHEAKEEKNMAELHEPYKTDGHGAHVQATRLEHQVAKGDLTLKEGMQRALRSNGHGYGRRSQRVAEIKNNIHAATRPTLRVDPSLGDADGSFETVGGRAKANVAAFTGKFVPKGTMKTTRNTGSLEGMFDLKPKTGKHDIGIGKIKMDDVGLKNIGLGKVNIKRGTGHDIGLGRFDLW